MQMGRGECKRILGGKAREGGFVKCRIEKGSWGKRRCICSFFFAVIF